MRVAVLEANDRDALNAILAGEAWIGFTAGDQWDAHAFVIGTGRLSGNRESEVVSKRLALFVAKGGSLVVFAQQQGVDYSVLPTPDGEPIRAYGWHEDNSCYTNAAYIDTFHPILASQSTALVTSNIDGYFESIPEGSTVLLRRVKNGYPAMFMYPYGQGWVIVSSSYDDWGGFNQAGPGARAIIRDAITWAKKPADLPIHQPGETVTVTLDLRNVTDFAATQARLVLMSPSRDRVVASQTVVVAVAAGATVQVPFSQAFAADAELGIYHVDYELLDEAGVMVQPVAETDSGRIVVARPPTGNPYRPSDLSATVVMPGGEYALPGDEVTFRCNFVNRAATDRLLRAYWEVDHSIGQLAAEVVVPAGGTAERDVKWTASAAGGGHRFWLHVFEPGGTPHPISYWVNVPGETAAYQLSDGKGFRVELLRPRVTVTQDRPVYAPGETATLTIAVQNQLDVAWEGRLVVERSPAWRPGDPPGVIILDEPVALPAGGPATVSVPVLLPPDQLFWGVGLGVSVVRGSAVLGRSVALVPVALPALRGLAFTAPIFSRTAASQARWEIENVSPVPLLAGTLRAELKSSSGDVVWQDERPLTLPARPDGRTTLTVDVPPLPAGFMQGTLTLTVDNGYGKQTRALARVDSRLSGFVNASQAGVAGEGADLVVYLFNTGTVHEEGTVTGSIDGIGPLPTVPYSLAPGMHASVPIVVEVPLDASRGAHEGRLVLPDGPRGFRLPIAPPKLAASIDEGRIWTAGEDVIVEISNTGGSRSTPALYAEVTYVTGKDVTLTLDPGQTGAVTLPLPAHLASGAYTVLVDGTDEGGVPLSWSRTITVAGATAALDVATDEALYTASSGSIDLTAQLANTGLALSGGLLHLEVTTACTGGWGESARRPRGKTASFHIETWDGSGWVERAVRHRSPRFETDQVDLAAWLPDPDGEYRVRIRQQGDMAYLDFVALISEGTIRPPTVATLLEAPPVDVLTGVSVADDVGPWVSNRTLEVEFPESPSPALIFRASEGDYGCRHRTIWQEDIPLDLAPGASLSFEETIPTPAEAGSYVARGVVRTRDGAIVASDEQAFEVVAGALTLTVETDAREYRTGALVVVSGTAQNLGAAAETGLTLRVYRTDGGSWELLHEESLDLAAGASRPYTFTTVASPCYDIHEMQFGAYLMRDVTTLVSGATTVRVGVPQFQVWPSVPDPLVRLAPTAPRPVLVEESDLDAVTKEDAGFLDGTFPFSLRLGGDTYTGFRQSADGFVELTLDGVPPSGIVAPCLWGFEWARVVAGALDDLDPSVSGYVGYKVYAAGATDRAGRVFTDDTVVFFWDAPAKGDTRHNRFQVLISADRLIRVDGTEVWVERECPTSGLALGPNGMFPSRLPAPFAFRLEQGVAFDRPFTSTVWAENVGDFAGTLAYDFGRKDGSRTTGSLTVGADSVGSVAFEDQITAATTYTLTLSGDAGDAAGTSEFVVEPTGRVEIGYSGDAVLTAGQVALPVTLLRLDGVGGVVTVRYTVSTPSGPVMAERTYDLEPGFKATDELVLDLPEGELVLSAEADVPVVMAPVALTAMPAQRMTLAACAGVAAGGQLPVTVDVSNSGREAFEGTVEVEGPGGSRTPVSVDSGEAQRLDIAVPLEGMPAGPATLAVHLLSADGALVAETAVPFTVVGPRVVLASSPDGASFDSAAVVQLPFTVRNDGDQHALGELTFDLFDVHRIVPFDLLPGESAELSVDVLLDPDVEQKTYSGRYVLTAARAAPVTGQVNFTVNGIALDVTASLDRPAYLDGETAHFTVSITNDRPALGTDYLVRVHYGDFEEVREVTVEGSAFEVFDIPLPSVTGEAVFLGISHPLGRSLYINTYHLRKADALITVTLDGQVYAPGTTVTVTATPSGPGSLTLQAPGYGETLDITGPTVRSFVVPADLPGGTYQVGWSFASGASSSSGSVPFDVAGLRVRVFEARLDKGRYGSGETLVSTLQVNTNEAATVTLRGFALDPEGTSKLLGETALSLQPEEDLLTTNNWPFTTLLAGLHRFVYGLYRGETLLASGSVAFDVGTGAVLGVRTDKTDYSLPTEPVLATTTAFVTGPVSLRLEVDGVSVATPQVTGTGIIEVPATLTTLSPGRHELVAVMEGDGYVSRRATTFALGTSLPDLVPGSGTATAVSGASWTLTVPVSNVGRTAAASTDLVVTEVGTGQVLGSATVPALGAGESHAPSITWNAAGWAGSHQVEATVDLGGMVLEFDESNNRRRSTIELPSVAVDAVAEATYPANTEAALAVNLTNLTTDTTYSGLVVHASVIRPDGTVEPLVPAPAGDLGPGATLSVPTPWAVGRSAPGTYVLDSRVVDAGGSVLGTAWRSFEVAPTRAFSGAVSATPNPAPEGAPVTFTGRVDNQGNVASSGQARFELVAPDNTIADARSAPADVPLEGGVDVTATADPLVVPAGDYRLDLSLEVGDETHPVAQSTLSVGATLTASFGYDLTPRVLVLLPTRDRPGVGEVPGDGDWQRRAAFVKASLQGTGALWAMIWDVTAFHRLVRSGAWDTCVVFADQEAPTFPIPDELREAVFSGEGLVFVQWDGGSDPGVEPALGGRLGGGMTSDRHTLNVVAGPLGPALTAAVDGPAARILPGTAAVVGTMDGGTPVLTANEFGRGRTVTFSFDPAVDLANPARPALEGLFGRAITYAARREPRPVRAGTVTPLGLVLSNPGQTARTADVSVELPFGVLLLSVDDEPVSTNPPTWHLAVPGEGTRMLRLQVVVPDLVGSFEASASVGVDGRPLGTIPRHVLQVERTTDQALADVIAALEATAVAPPDQAALLEAIARLRHAQQPDVGPAYRVYDGLQAGLSLGQITSADVSEERREVGALLTPWERSWVGYLGDPTVGAPTSSPGRP